MTNVCTPLVSASVLFSVKYIGSYGICTVLCVNEFHSPFLFYILGTFSDFNVEFFFFGKSIVFFSAWGYQLVAHSKGSFGLKSSF